MNNKFIDVFYEPHIGIGLRWYRADNHICISASIPFVTATFRFSFIKKRGSDETN